MPTKISNGQLNEGIAQVFTGILSQAKAELEAIEDPALLEKFWYYRHDATKPTSWLMYEFYTCLDIYKSKCRDWETMKNGSCCVVERVRDQYLMPKIKQFLKDIEK